MSALCVEFRSVCCQQWQKIQYKYKTKTTTYLKTNTIQIRKYSKSKDNVCAVRWVPLCLLPAVTYKHCLSSKKQIKWEMWGNTTKLYMTAVTYKYCLSSKKQTKCADEETQQNYVWWKKTSKIRNVKKRNHTTGQWSVEFGQRTLQWFSILKLNWCTTYLSRQGG